MTFAAKVPKKQQKKTTKKNIKVKFIVVVKKFFVRK